MRVCILSLSNDSSGRRIFADIIATGSQDFAYRGNVFFSSILTAFPLSPVTEKLRAGANVFYPPVTEKPRAGGRSSWQR